jgi:hypothetical protein
VPPRRLLIALACALLAALGPRLSSRAAAAAAFPATGDEFVGPFASWIDVTSRYGAAGDGIADATAALQRALTELGAGGRSPVLYLPAGTYRITGTLVLANRQNVSVIGADPSATTLVWDGPDGGTMLVVDGVAYSRIARLTFDGRTRAAIAVDQSWNGKTGPFDTGNDYSDDRFVDAGIGLRGGFHGHGFAETTVARAEFVRNSVAGISLGNFNALDLWVWYSLFDRCAVGVTNGSGAGNFHVYNSVFRESSVADLFMRHTGGFSARGNYSVGSRAFFLSGPNTNNPATIHLQGNTIVDPVEPTAIRLHNQGPALLTDNVVRSRAGAAGPVVQWTSFFGADVASVGNTFTVANAVSSNGRVLSVDDRTVDAAALTLVEPSLPPPWPNLRRPVFDVAADAGGAAIQQAIDRAAAERGRRPVVHIPAGTHAIARTIVVPASDVQIVGDGYATVLRWSGAGSGPVVRIDGPGQAALRELRVDGAGRADGVVIANADRPGSRIYMQGVQLRAGKVTDLHVDGVDHAYLQLEDFGQAASPDGRAIVVRGGPERRAGRPATGRVSIFSGASSRNRLSLDLSDGGMLLVRDVWYESRGAGYAHVRGRATFTADGLRVASTANQSPPAFDFSALAGTAAVIATHFDDRIAVSGDGREARVLALSVFCQQSFARCYEHTASPPARSAVVHARELSRMFLNRSSGVADTGVAATPEFVRELLAHARAERASPLAALPPGVTDLRFFRVWIDSGMSNVIVQGR